jgi:uncharacterized protein YjiS (DUF1127 family)
MTTQTHCNTATASLRPLDSTSSSLFVEAMSALHRAAQRVDSWLAARSRFAADRDALVRMSDRELIDIGLDRASVDFVAGGGRVRDYPF